MSLHHDLQDATELFVQAFDPKTWEFHKSNKGSNSNRIRQIILKPLVFEVEMHVIVTSLLLLIHTVA